MPLRRAALALLALSGLWSVSAHAETIHVTIENLVFAPATVNAKVGDVVEWDNKDILAHTATATDGAWDVMIGPKQNARLALKTAGTFDYFCRFHPNMKARIVVAPQ